MTKFLDKLNAAQREAVVNYKKPSLIVAGAGSGKTRVLTSRIAYMIKEGVHPGSILALTFTNKAAAEMRERVCELVGDNLSRYIWMGTFHSIFYRILRAEGERLGFTPNFTIYDTSGSESLLNTIIKGFNLNTDDYKAREVHSRISLAKNNLVTAEGYAANTSLIAEDRQRKKSEFSNIYLEYSRRCRANNAMDFDDLLIYTNILFRDNPDILNRYQERFKYILVDEYQDTNYAQYLIIRRLAQAHSNVCVVGDDAQSIYSFRGAKVENILQFRNDFPESLTFKLEQNYRSTQNIVNAANSIIAKNSRKIDKTVFSEKEEGDKIKVLKAYTDQEEASIIADTVRTVGRESNNNWSEIAILYRNNAQSRAIEEALRRRDVPYIIYKGHSFYERKEIKDLIGYFRLIVNPQDDEAFKRVINTPARGIGDVTLSRIAKLASDKGVSMWEVVESLDAENPELKSAAKRLFDFAEMIKGFSLGRNEKKLYDFGVEVATQSGIIGSYKMNPSPESDSALENIGELLGSMQNFKDERIILAYEEEDNSLEAEPTIEEWLQNISLMTDMDSKSDDAKNRVVLMTVHSAKGLEFDNVFIVGVEENLFPSQMSIMSPDKLEEERRLFYVAVTRARQKAIISFAMSRFKWGNTEFSKPSRFITEIDKEYIDLPAEMEDESEVSDDPIAALRKRFDSRNKYSGQSQQSYAADNKTGGYNRTSSYGATNTRHKEQNENTARPKINIPTPTNLKSVGSRKLVSCDEEVCEKAQTNNTQKTTPQTDKFSIGMIVEHSKFGRGKILDVENMVSDIKITVLFDDPAAGKKNLLSKYANLKIIN